MCVPCAQRRAYNEYNACILYARGGHLCKPAGYLGEFILSGAKVVYCVKAAGPAAGKAVYAVWLVYHRAGYQCDEV